MLGVIGRVGGPASLLGLEPDIFLALLEGIARESPAESAYLDTLYDEAEKAKRIDEVPAPVNRADRARQIAAVTRLFGG